MHKRYLWLMAGALAVAVSAPRPAHAADPAVPGAPAGWFHADINGPGAAGDSKVTGTGAAAVWTISGSGNDIQNAADQFQFAYTNLTGDGGVTARILSQVAGEPSWTKTGVMLRESTAPGSRMITINFTSNNGLEGGSRLDTDGGWSSPGANGVGTHSLAGGPIWLRAQHKGTSFQILSSSDGSAWKLWGTQTIAMDVTKPILAGLCVTSHMDGSLATATFDNVSVSADLVKPAPGGPGGVRIEPAPGAVLITFGGVGNAVGYNIYRGEAGKTDAPVLVNADKPTPYNWLIDDGGGKGLTNGTSYVYTVKGVLSDGSTTLASDPVLALPQVPIALNGNAFFSYDIGTTTPGSTTLDASNMLTISASGYDITGDHDGFRFVATGMAGDYSITAKILDKPAQGSGNTSLWIKSGIMIRESLDPGSRMADLFLTNGNGLSMEDRRGYRLNAQTVVDANSFGNAVPVADADVKPPYFLRLTRTGDMIEGGYSTDGTTFTNVDPPNGAIPNLSPFTYAGLCVAAGSDGNQGIAKFDATTIKIQ